MFSHNPRCKMQIPPFDFSSVMQYSRFAPRLYNLCRSLGFTPGKIMPARAFCSDENQGYPVILLTKQFGTFPFNHGRAGGIVAGDRHLPHAHHGKDLMIVQASHVGYDPDTGEFGTYRRVHTEQDECRPTCGKLNSIIKGYQEDYRFAGQNILLRKQGDEYLVTIDHQLLNETREQGLFLNKDRFMASEGDGNWQVVQVQSTAKTCRMLPEAVQQLGHEFFKEDTPTPIGDKLPADWFYFERDLDSVKVNNQHIDENLFQVMSQIVTSSAPMLTAALVNTMVEFDSTFRSIAKTNVYSSQKVFLLSGVNIDISPENDQTVPLTKFAPWAAYYKDEHGEGQVWEQQELAEKLREQPIENPDQIDLEAAVETMLGAKDMEIAWPE